MINIDFCKTTGSIKSLKIADDPFSMNWLREDCTWGTPTEAELVSSDISANTMTSVYKLSKAELTVRRIPEKDRYREIYTYKNVSDCDVFFRRGELGIYTPFCDIYDGADICMTNRCNAHIWCGGDVSYINAMRMGVSSKNIGLALLSGSLDSYSIKRDYSKNSNDRGIFILHPSPFSLMSGETKTFEWVIFEHGGDDDFIQKLNSLGILTVSAEHFTVFEGENIKLGFSEIPSCVTLDGAKIPFCGKTLEYSPKRLGEHKFLITYGEKHTFAKTIVVPKFEDTLKKRINYIIKNQQFLKSGSPLDGAYLIYDCREHYKYFDNSWPDHNASRERLGMSLLIAKYLQSHKDPEILQSFMKNLEFIKREVVDTETGDVYNTVLKNKNMIRLYNAPWAALLMMETYKLTKDTEYLEIMMRILRKYYEGGGARFYPNGISIAETVEALIAAGMRKEAADLTALYRTHVDNMVKNGTNYPPHEVNYEQTIVTPAATFISQFCKITGETKYIEEAEKQIRVLERFNGHQPDYHMNETAIRHWDDFWFGKEKMYGDTFPHYWSCLTGVSFLHYAEISGDSEYLSRAHENIRNCMCLFFPDGSASCAYVYPFSVNERKGEFYDDWANDQDFALYEYLKFFYDFRH